LVCLSVSSVSKKKLQISVQEIFGGDGPWDAGLVEPA